MFDQLGRPVLCDFGASRLTDVGSGRGVHHQSVGISVPIRWMAPEVLGPQPHYQYASDVWSMGVVVWQILTHQHEPYPEVHDLMAVAHGLVAGHLDLRPSVRVPLPWHNSAAWAPLRALALACLHPQPQLRPRTESLCSVATWPEVTDAVNTFPLLGHYDAPSASGYGVPPQPQ
jgi:serine/threonine protein kinase